MAESTPTSTQILYPEPELMPIPVDREVAEARRLAARYELEFVDLDKFNIDHALFRSIPADLMLRYGFVPYRRDGNTLLIVVSDPRDVQTIDEVGVQLNTPIRVTVGAASAIQSILKKSESSQRVLEEATTGFQIQILREDAAGDENLTVDKLTQGDSPVIRLVDSMVFTALQRRASDIHIETGDDAVHVKYRIDGVLQPAMRPIDKSFNTTIISRIKVMSELDIAETRVPQDGRFKVTMRGGEIDVRVSILPSIFGEDAVLRILDKQALADRILGLTLDQLGFDPRCMHAVRRLAREPYGMLLVTGPTGSGKTTTLYAALSEVNRAEDKIITIEDPIEYQLPGVLQIPVNEKKGLTFARGLRSILRHDPDKIMVGEIRDPETAQIAIQAALTGHLVFTTVHANNAFDLIGRFLHMNADAHSLASALKGVVAQRLVRLVCTHCAQEETPSEELLLESGLKKESVQEWRFRAGRGCGACRGTGYRGRKAIGEVLRINDEFAQLLVSRAPAPLLREAAARSGLRPLRDAALDLVRAGETTLQEINRVTAVA
jgi:type II secretory ATPase GspE/PulE/Tfp pilus assembly ATPase PilB-like protein